MGIFDNVCNLDQRNSANVLGRACAASFYSLIMNDSGMYDPQTQLIDAGLDPEELEFMDYEERKAVLERVGLNPRDFDF